MISNLDIQNYYVHLYECLRKYIWPFDVVEAIADLEVVCFQACPSLLEVSTRLAQLKSATREVAEGDEDLYTQFEMFESALGEADDVYTVLNQVHEVMHDENNKIINKQ